MNFVNSTKRDNLRKQDLKFRSVFTEWKPEYIWCILGIVMLLMELSNPAFVIMFFGIGALIVAAVLLFVNLTLNIQIILFIVVSLLSMILLRQWIKSVFMGVDTAKNRMPANIESFVGQRAVADGDIVPGTVGKVKFHGTTWNAISSEIIPSGTSVTIEKKDNLTFEVKPLK